MNYFKSIGLALLLLTITSSSVDAQAIESYEARFYQGGVAPIQTYGFAQTAVACNLAPLPTTASNVNPTRLRWADPSIAGRECEHVPAAGSVLLSFPVGSYEGALVAINAAGTSGESNRAPFVRVAPPSAPSTFRVVR